MLNAIRSTAERSETAFATSLRLHAALNANAGFVDVCQWMRFAYTVKPGADVPLGLLFPPALQIAVEHLPAAGFTAATSDRRNFWILHPCFLRQFETPADWVRAVGTRVNFVDVVPHVRRFLTAMLPVPVEYPRQLLALIAHVGSRQAQCVHTPPNVFADLCVYWDHPVALGLAAMCHNDTDRALMFLRCFRLSAGVAPQPDISVWLKINREKLSDAVHRMFDKNSLLCFDEPFSSLKLK